ncbi:MAG TPA: DUF305 domain-containing protein [Longimicrobium sp.]|nr:DUF305 domain-containing protein [Longimicrobium sp.]
MTKSTASRSAAALLVAAVTACATPPRAAAVQPAPAPVVRADTVPPPRWSPADIAFMQGMIGHHAQALRMTALVPGRSARADVRLLAERIEASQRSEIAQMRQWLRTRGIDTAAVPVHQHQHAGGADDHGMIPGMLTEPELEALAAASGAAFDRLFLEDMIRHHEGAVTMVATLFFTNGAGQDPEVFRLASDVDADQRAEISRMRAMLAPPSPP